MIAGNRRAGEGRRIDRTRNQRGRDEWPRRVVDQHDVRPLMGKRFQPGTHRGLTGGSAIGGRRMAQRTDRGVKHCHVIGI